MKATEEFGLPYPEPEDFGDGSTQLAAFAFAVDEELQQQIDQYNEVLRPPTYIFGKSGTTNYSSGSSFQVLQWDTLIYASDTTNMFPASNKIQVPEPGIYHAGLYVWATVVGTVNLNTLRQFKMEFYDRQGPAIDDAVTREYQFTTLEAASGVACTIYGVFPVYSPEFSEHGLTCYFKHSNTSSQMQVQPSSFMWLSRLGDLEI